MRGDFSGWGSRDGRRGTLAGGRRGRESAPGSRRRARGRLHHELLEPRLCLSASLGTDAAVDALTTEFEWGGRMVTARADSWIVRADTGFVGPIGSAAGMASLGGTVGGGWDTFSLGEGFYSLTTPGATVGEVVGWASSMRGIAYVEPNFVIEPSSVPNDPSFGQLWGLNNTGQNGGVVGADIDALEAWSITTGSRDVVIAVIDTGIDYSHPDLAANIWRNPGEIPGNGIDDDGNGFIDDVYGYDFVNRDGDPMDDNGHGTHVAGTIGAVGNDGRGIVGVNWQVSMMGLKFLSGGGSGSTADAVRAINYATMMRRDFGVNIVATNNSWGGGGFSQALADAINAGGNEGILFIAAAGNEGNNNDVFPAYPASIPSDAIISVAATDSGNRLASFSNYGATSVDVGAPGVAIYSTLPGNRYGSYSGTSMAAPHVAGIVGLLAAANPDATAADLRDAVLSTATPVSSLAGRVATGGLANAAAALDAIGVGPTLRGDIVDVSPDPRLDAVAAIEIAFSQAVSGFDVGDLALSRDGTLLSLAEASLTTQDSVTWTLAGLTSLTGDVGSYSLVLTAAGSNIAAVADGTPLERDATDSWIVTPPPPPAPFEPNDSIATAAPIELTGGRTRLSGVIGDGLFTASDVDLFSIRLVAGATISLDVDARSLSPASTLDSYLRLFDSSGRQLAFNDDTSGQFSLDSALTYTVATSGIYYIGLSSYGNSGYDPNVAGTGRVGATTGRYELAISVNTPTPTLSVDIIDVTPDPRPDAVDTITIAFTAAVTGFDLGDLALSRNGTAIPLTAAALTTSNDARWTLSGLEGLTAEPGDYLLVLVAAGSGIESVDGASLTADAREAWTVTPPPPPPALEADIIDVSPDPRFDAVGTIVITFNRAVAGFDLADLTLTRDGAAVTLDTATVALTSDDATRWTLADLTSATADIGSYSLVLTAAGSGITDADGVALDGNVTETWTVVAPPPPAAYEPNDAISVATPLTLENGRVTISATVGDGVFERADVDLFAVELVAGGTLTLDVDARTLPIPSNLDSYLRLFDSSGRQVAQNDDFFGTFDSYLTYAPTATGTYYVGVSAYGNSRYNPFVAGSGRAANTAGEYSLTVVFEAPVTPDPDPDPNPNPDPDPSPAEPNDSIATASSVSFTLGRAAVEGVIGDGAFGRRDVDLYAVELTAGATIEIDIDARDNATNPSMLDSYLRLFDAAGNQLAFNDDGPYSVDSYLRHTVTADGIYYVGVSSYLNGNYDPTVAGSGRNGSTVGSYLMTMSHDARTDPGPDPDPDPAPGPVEPNDSIATASLLVPVNFRVAVEGTIGDGDYGRADVDVYAINLWAGSEILIDIDARVLETPSGLDSYLRLFDASGRQLARNDDARGSLDSFLTYTVQATGIYYIGVSSYGNSRYDVAVAGSARAGRTTGDYRMSVTVNEPTRPAEMSTLGFPDASPPASVVELLRTAAFASIASGSADENWTSLRRVR